MTPPSPDPVAAFTLGRQSRVGLFVALFFFYMLTGSRERPWADATPVYEVAESIVTHGTINIPTQWPPTLRLGKDGKVYAVAPLLQSLLQVPGAGLRRIATALWPASDRYSWPLVSHLATAALGALTCLLFMSLCQEEGFSLPASLIGTLGLGLGSYLWVYARYPYSETLQAACFTGLFRQVRRLQRRPGAAGGAALGIWAGLLINAKLVYPLVLPGAALFLACHLRRRPRELIRTCAAAVAAMVPFFLLIALYNHARWGSFATSGSATGGPAFGERLWVGLWGMFLAPGKSLFLYCPILLVSLVGLPRLWRRRPELLVALLLLAAPVILVNARLLFWAGDYAWGPRYIVFLVPVLHLPAVMLIDDVIRMGPRWKRRLSASAVATVFLAGLFVQLLGNVFFWDHFIRLSTEASKRWLGVPNSAQATARIEFGAGVCGSCFEDMHALQWLPPFSPLEGHFWLAPHVIRGDSWVQAEADAPWHRYTTLQLNIAKTYAPFRVDWWLLDFGGRARTAGVTLLFLLTLGTLMGTAAFVRGLRPRAGPPGSPVILSKP